MAWARLRTKVRTPNQHAPPKIVGSVADCGRRAPALFVCSSPLRGANCRMPRPARCAQALSNAATLARLNPARVLRWPTRTRSRDSLVRRSAQNSLSAFAPADGLFPPRVRRDARRPDALHDRQRRCVERRRLRDARGALQGGVVRRRSVRGDHAAQGTAPAARGGARREVEAARAARGPAAPVEGCARPAPAPAVRLPPSSLRLVRAQKSSTGSSRRTTA